MKKPSWISVVGLIVGCCMVVPHAHAGDQCATCHGKLGDKPSSLFSKDIHHQRGVSCSGCHGGDATSDDMERAMDPKAGFIGVPKGDAVSVACAKCHSDAGKMKAWHSDLPTGQLELLQASVHGKLSTTGKEHIAQCTTCHGAHGIVSAKNPASPVYPLNVVATCAACHSNAVYIRSYNPSLAVDQREKYRTSVHGMRNAKGDAKTAACASCHGSHGILSSTDVKSAVYPTNLPGTCSKCHSDAGYMKGYGIPTDQYAKFAKSVHGVALLQKNDLAAPACNKCHGNHGATPPGVESVSKVCGTCHALNADLFSASPHKKAFDERKLPECETCHGNHEIVTAANTLLGVTPEAVCTKCHSQKEFPEGYRVAATMRGLIDSLETNEARAKSLVEDAEQKGMEVGEAKFKLRDIRQSRLEARTMVHSFNQDKFREVVGKGLSVAVQVGQEGQRAIDDYVFRRIGLGVSTLVITVLAIALWLFIRRLERRQQQERTAT